MEQNEFTYRCGVTISDLIRMGSHICGACDDRIACAKEYIASVKKGSKPIKIGVSPKAHKDCNQSATVFDAGVPFRNGRGVDYGMEAGQ
jgi:hypothetical protein